MTILLGGLVFVPIALLEGTGGPKMGRRLARRPRRWELDVARGRLDVRGRLFSRSLRLDGASAIVIATEKATVRDARHGRTYGLFVKLGWRWTQLLRTEWIADDPRAMAARLPALAAFAVPVARALDVPIRHVP
jgi:hypothetical protein